MTATANLPQCSVQELLAMMQESKPPFLLDVREIDEWETCKLAGATLVPLGQLTTRCGEVPNDKPVVVYCHHGGRSARAVQWLLQQGYSQAVNLAGGIEAWAVHIDPHMPRY